MKQNGPARDEAPQRDPLLEEAFTHFVQQAQAPAEFAERVRARVNLLPPEGWLRSWARHIATALAQASGRWKGPRAIGREEIQWRRPRTSRVRLGWLVTGLVLSVLGNVWLGVQLRGKPGADDTRLAPARAAGPSQETREIRLAFTDGVREQARHHCRGPLPRGCLHGAGAPAAAAGDSQQSGGVEHSGCPAPAHRGAAGGAGCAAC
jgi:hypothetical protein